MSTQPLFAEPEALPGTVPGVSPSALPCPEVIPPAMPPGIPAEVEAALWRGDQLGRSVSEVRPSGFAELDTHLPGGGWPCGALTEILTPQFAALEWRLLGHALEQACTQGQSIAVVGPPGVPHLPGLRHAGIDERRLVWVRAETMAQRLWALEQLVKSGALGAIVGWLPQARPEQVRRLQVLASQAQAPVFLCRPASAAHEASAAPLRLQASAGPDWELQVHILKRKGAPLASTLRLASVPGGLRAVLTPRLRQPSRWMNREAHDAVVRLAPELRRPLVPAL
jgi:protein ImuA